MLTKFKQHKESKVTRQRSEPTEKEKLEIEIYEFQIQNEFIKDKLARLSSSLLDSSHRIDDLLLDEELDGWQDEIKNIEKEVELFKAAMLRNQREIEVRESRREIAGIEEQMEQQQKPKLVVKNKNFSSM